MNRERQAKLNIIVTLACQVLLMVCGIILPRVFIRFYGSEAYGATASISQFIAYITLLEGGVCGVARAALYKPLADHDMTQVANVISEIKTFFKKVGYIFIAYILVLACVFKSISHVEVLNWFDSFVLVIVISVSTFAQYFIGISYAVLIQADQKTYINNIVNIITTIANTIFVVALSFLGCSLILVKLISSLCFAARPVFLYLYVSRNYEIPKSVSKGGSNVLRDKWVALGQHIAYFLHSHTDIAVLTILGNLKLVAVYSVYSMVVTAIQNIMSSFSTGMESLFGDMYAKKENGLLVSIFNLYDTMISFISIVLFSCTAVLIIPFINIYTRGISDANYIEPLFGVLLVISALLYALRTPYHSMIIAAGHFRQTNIAAYGEAIINITLSVLLVKLYGIVGVAIGTVVATSFRFLFYLFYLTRNLIKRSLIFSIKRALVNVLGFLVIYHTGSLLKEFVVIDNYLKWGLTGCAVFLLAFLITLVLNVIFYKEDMVRIKKKVLQH